MNTTKNRATINQPYLNDGGKYVLARVGNKQDSWLEVASWVSQSYDALVTELTKRVKTEGNRLDAVLDWGFLTMDYEGKRISVQSEAQSKEQGLAVRVLKERFPKHELKVA